MHLLKKHSSLVAVGVGILACVIWWYRAPIWEALQAFYTLISDKESIKTLILSYGKAAPLVFIGMQILQVMFAPIPGEATGFIGGFLFGAAMGFFYSSIGLSIGSWLNFIIGRFLGKRYLRKLVPQHVFLKYDTLLKHQGIFAILFLFVFPGFPKDYLCLFLGISTLPIKVFLILATFGRMPGTLMLSLQGAFLFEQNYLMLAIFGSICLILAWIAYRYRDSLYQWVDGFNNRKQ
jgi:uncharacterized membrane protein YdjX (TVP38/TMEM64 family)